MLQLYNYFDMAIINSGVYVCVCVYTYVHMYIQFVVVQSLVSMVIFISVFSHLSQGYFGLDNKARPNNMILLSHGRVWLKGYFGSNLKICVPLSVSSLLYMTFILYNHKLPASTI